METKRLDHLDAVAGLLIVFMMFTHIMQRCGLTGVPTYLFLQRVLSFFMAWFFFKSGRFAKDTSLREEWAVVWKKLLVPYLLFSLIGWVVDTVWLLLSGARGWNALCWTPLHTLLVSGSLPGNLPLWFLPILASVRLIACLLRKLRIPVPVVAVVSFGLAWLLSRLVPIPFYLGSSAAGLTFYSLGTLLREKADSRPVWIVAAVVYAALLLFYPSSIDLRSNSVTEGSYPAAFLFSLAAILAFDGVAAEVTALLKPKTGIFCWIGRHAMSYFVVHWIVLTVCLIFFRSMYEVDWRILAWLMGAACLGIPPLVWPVPTLRKQP